MGVCVTVLAGGKLDVDTSDLDPSYLSGVARVFYTYDPAQTATPKPASIALLGLAITAFEVVRRRFRT